MNLSYMKQGLIGNIMGIQELFMLPKLSFILLDKCKCTYRLSMFLSILIQLACLES